MTAASCTDVAPAKPVEAKADSSATFVLFSNDMDKALAGFTMATTAAAAGMKVNLFFTFWGLSVLRRPDRRRKVGLIDRIFGVMIPKGVGRLRTSQLNFCGMGPKMFRWRMGRKQQPDLAALMEQARALGVRFLVCEASAGVLGLSMEDLVDGVEIAGAMTCIREAAASEISMFI